MLLNSALDIGIREFDFWEMTIAEVIRAIESYNRMKVYELKQKASCDYILAKLITKGVGIVLGSKESFPSIEEVYPDLYADTQKAEQEKIQEQKTNLSTLRFLQFAQSYNQRFKTTGGAKEDK